MRYAICLLAILIVGVSTKAFSQPNHYGGIGTYISSPFVTDMPNDELIGIRPSPFVDYLFNSGRLNISIGLGTWNSALINDLTYYSITNTDSTWKTRVISSHQYAFVPLTVGFNVIDHHVFKFGVEVHGLLKYLMLVRNVTKSSEPDFALPVSFLNGAELDQNNFQRLGYAGGGGLYFAWAINRVMPKLGIGYLTDFTNVRENDLVEYRFQHVYATASLNLMLHRQRGYQKHDKMIRW